MGKNNNTETERKYLIKYPDISVLEKKDNYSYSQIEQAYVEDSLDGMFGRIRKRGKEGRYRYYKTFKRDITAVKRIEIETEISVEEYQKLMEKRRKGFAVIEKTRHVFSFEGHVFEVDVFPFWKDKAFMEVELEDENEEIKLPPFVEIIEEVTEDLRYRNSALSAELGKGEIQE